VVQTGLCALLLNSHAPQLRLEFACACFPDFLMEGPTLGIRHDEALKRAGVRREIGSSKRIGGNRECVEWRFQEERAGDESSVARAGVSNNVQMRECETIICSAPAVACCGRSPKEQACGRMEHTFRGMSTHSHSSHAFVTGNVKCSGAVKHPLHWSCLAAAHANHPILAAYRRYTCHMSPLFACESTGFEMLSSFPRKRFNGSAGTLHRSHYHVRCCWMDGRL
jgi:hypothetical protein